MGVRRSQVLLADETWTRRLVARVPEAGFGVEWAAGRGALTRFLVETWDYCLALELDAGFCRQLRDRLRDGLGVLRTDAKKYPLPTCRSPYPLVGNLPYHITGPLLIRVLEFREHLSRFQGLVQREVGDRLGAEPGDGDFGGLSLLYRTYGKVQVPFTVPPSAFDPEPEVHSSWVEFNPRPSNLDYDFEHVRRFVRFCFQQPRKTLINNLARETERKDFWRDRFRGWGWSTKRRPATLTPEDLGRLMNAWDDAELSWPLTNSRVA